MQVRDRVLVCCDGCTRSGLDSFTCTWDSVPGENGHHHQSNILYMMYLVLTPETLKHSQVGQVKRQRSSTRTDMLCWRASEKEMRLLSQGLAFILNLRATLHWGRS